MHFSQNPTFVGNFEAGIINYGCIEAEMKMKIP